MSSFNDINNYLFMSNLKNRITNKNAYLQSRLYPNPVHAEKSLFFRSNDNQYHTNSILLDDSDASMMRSFFIGKEENSWNSENVINHGQKAQSIGNLKQNLSNSTEGSEVSSRVKYIPIREDSISNKQVKNRLIMDDRAKRFWSKKEDNLLLSYIQERASKNWKSISEFIKTKSPQQCAYRYGKLMTDLNKKKWSRKDDIKLLDQIEVYGFDWKMISQYYDDRNDKDLEFRYREKLNPNINRSEFSYDEDNLILKLHNELGNKWYEISKHFINRTSKLVKKRFQTYLKQFCKNRPKFSQNQNQSHSQSYNDSLNQIRENSEIISKNSSKVNVCDLSEVYQHRHNQDDVSMIDSNLNGLNRHNDVFSNEVQNSRDFGNNLPNNNDDIGINMFDLNEQETFNVDLFFDNNQQLNENFSYVESVKNDQNLNDSTLLKVQFSRIDDYFNNLMKSYRIKCQEAKKLFYQIRENNIFLSKNEKIELQISNLFEQARSLKNDFQSNMLSKDLILKYIELVIMLIQQIKSKISLINSISKEVSEIGRIVA